MNPEQFAYWLQGFFELKETDSIISARQEQIIKDHLQLVFKKETPDRKIDKEKLLERVPDHRKKKDILTPLTPLDPSALQQGVNYADILFCSTSEVEGIVKDIQVEVTC